MKSQLKFEFVCKQHPDEVLESMVWSGGTDPCQIAIFPCTQCAKEVAQEWKELEGEIKDKLAQVELDVHALVQMVIVR